MIHNDLKNQLLTKLPSREGIKGWVSRLLAKIQPCTLYLCSTNGNSSPEDSLRMPSKTTSLLNNHRFLLHTQQLRKLAFSAEDADFHTRDGAALNLLNFLMTESGNFC